MVEVGTNWLVRLEWRPAGWSVFLSLLIFRCTIKSRSSLLAPAHPGGPGKRAVKRLCAVNFCGYFSWFSRDWLGRTSPKWPILCRVVGLYKTLTQSIKQSLVESSRCMCGSVTLLSWRRLCVTMQNELRRAVRRRGDVSSGIVSKNQRISDLVFRLGRRGRRHGFKVLQKFCSRFSRGK